MTQKLTAALLMVPFSTKISAFTVHRRVASGLNTRSGGHVWLRTMPTSFGGDYAGNSATFSGSDGTLIKVPEYMVPDSMVEWGQVPSCLQCIVSEDVLPDEQEGPDPQRWILERKVVVISPEVGCALDNQHTTTTTERVPVDQYQDFSFEDVQVSTAFVEDTKRYMECVFVTNNASDKGVVGSTRTRVRVNLNEKNAIVGAIHVTKERKTSEESSRGTIAEGGGLDARTVMKLIGKDNVNTPFSEGEVVDLAALEGRWTATETGEDAERDGHFWQPSLSLCGDIIVRYASSDPCALEISLILNSGVNTDGAPMKRVVVSHALEVAGVANASTVTCFEEQKK